MIWLKKEYLNLNIQYQLIESDARKISEKIADQLDLIVTEPDLGPNTGIIKNQSGISIKLEKLYLECLKNWQQVLKSGGKVVIVLPNFTEKITNPQVAETRPLVKNVIDKAQVMGYSLEAGPISYHRPQAKVGRNICVFRFNN